MRDIKAGDLVRIKKGSMVMNRDFFKEENIYVVFRAITKHCILLSTCRKSREIFGLNEITLVREKVFLDNLKQLRDE